MRGLQIVNFSVAGKVRGAGNEFTDHGPEPVQRCLVKYILDDKNTVFPVQIKLRVSQHVWVLPSFISPHRSGSFAQGSAVKLPLSQQGCAVGSSTVDITTVSE